MWFLSYWTLPLFSSLVWLAMLLAMLLTWVTQGEPHYPSMDPTQHIAYISDVGAQGLKPLFIAMGTVSVVTFTLGFMAERWLRHRGRLAHNTSWFQKSLSIISIIAAIAGAAGLILLTIFDTLRHPRLHDAFLILFIAGYVVSAIFICWEYQRLGIHFRQYRILRASFWIKLTFIFVEVGLAIGFGVSSYQGHYNTAAILEWVVALVYFFYVLSFFMDFIPAVHTKGEQSKMTSEMAMTQSAESGLPIAHDGDVDRYGHHADHHHGAANNHYLQNGHTGRHYAAGAQPGHVNANGYANNVPANQIYGNGNVAPVEHNTGYYSNGNGVPVEHNNGYYGNGVAKPVAPVNGRY